jgi:hypothetical protein
MPKNNSQNSALPMLTDRCVQCGGKLIHNERRMCRSCVRRFVADDKKQTTLIP